MEREESRELRAAESMHNQPNKLTVQTFDTPEGPIVVFSHHEFKPSDIHIVGSTGIAVGGNGRTSQ